MPRYIDADALIANLDKALLFARTNEEIADLKLCKEIVRSAPAISPDEVLGVGKWLNDVGEFGFPEIPCSVCGYKSGHYGFKYCPNCGARMKGSEDGTTDN